MRTTKRSTGSKSDAKGVSFNVAEIEASELQPAFEVKDLGVEVPSITSTPNHQPVGGVDTLGVCCWVYWNADKFDTVKAEIEETQQKAKGMNKDSLAAEFYHVTGRYVQTVVAEVFAAGTRQGGGFPYRIKVEGMFFAIGRQQEAGKRHNVMVSIPGAVMMQHGWCPVRVWNRVNEILTALGMYSMGKHTLSRVDLFADCPGIHVRNFRPLVNRNGFVCRSRTLFKYSGIDLQEVKATIQKSFKRGFDAVVSELRSVWAKGEMEAVIAAVTEAQTGTFDLAEYGKTSEDLGWQFGRGQMVCRIYNKVRQLEKYHPERMEVMREAWGVGAEVPVTRVEFQMRSNALRLRSITTIEDLSKALPTLGHELTHEWIIGVSKYDGIHTDRRETHRLWKRVQAYFKVALKYRDNIDGTRLERMKPEAKDNGHQLARMSLGFVTSAAARNCGPCADPMDVRATIIDQLDAAADHVGGWDKVLWNQVDRAFRHENELGLPFSGQTNRTIMNVLMNRTFEVCDELDSQRSPGQVLLQKSLGLN